MAQVAYNFDTLAYAKRLKEAGMDERIAETQAEEQADIIAKLQNEQLVSKKDLKELEKAIRELEMEIIKIQHSIKELDAKMEHNTQELRRDIKELNLSLFIKLSSAMVVIIGVFHALNKFI